MKTLEGQDKALDAELDHTGNLTCEIANRLNGLEQRAESTIWKTALQAAKMEAIQLGLMLEGLRASLRGGFDEPSDAEPLGTYVCRNCANAKHLACNSTGCKCICTVKEIRIPAGTKFDASTERVHFNPKHGDHPLGSEACCASPDALGKL